MTRYILLLLMGLCFSPALLFAGSRVDSLKIVFQTTSLSEAEQGLLAFRIAEQYRNTASLDSALRYADLGLQLSETGGIDRKMMYYDLAGQIHFRLGNYILASRFFSQGKTLALAAKDEKEMAYFSNSSGICYATTGDYQRALESFQASYQYFLRHGSKKKILTTKKNVANLHGQLRRVDKAIEMLEEVYQEALNNNYKRLACKSLILQSGFYEELDQLNQAIDKLEIALSLATEREFREVILCNEDLGRIYGKLKDFEKADSLLKTVLELSMELGGKSYIASTYVSMGDNEILRANYFEATDWYIKAFDWVDSTNINKRKSIYQKLAQSYRHQKDYVNADLYGQKVKAIADEIYSVDNARRMAELEANFEFEEKRFRIQQELIRRDRRQFQLLLASLGMIFLLAVMGIYYYYYRKEEKQKARLKEQVATNEKILEEQQKLLDKKEELFALLQKLKEE